MSRISLAVLDKKRQGIFPRLRKFESHGYLAGGTALALQLQHRRSYDFDIFLRAPIEESFRRQIIDFFSPEKFYLDNPEQLSFGLKNSVEMTFLHYHYAHIYPLITTEGISLADSRDIAADKAFTLGRRAVWRDYVDLYFLLKKKIIDLERLIKIAEKKFQKEFNAALFMEQLIYFKDITIVPMEFLGSPVSQKDIRSFLETAVKNHFCNSKYS